MNSTKKTTTQPLDRSKPPKPGAIANVSFPPFIERSLSNGLKVYIVENHEQPIISTSLHLRGGSILDPAEHQGLASVTADMLTKGTMNRSALQIADEIDFVGGSLSSHASWDSMSVTTTTLTRFHTTGLDLLADVLLRPTFPEEELDRAKLQRLASLKQAKADAGYLADTVFTKIVFPNHPYGQQASGTEASIPSISRDNILKFYERHFGPNNGFVVAAGDVNVEEYIALLENLLGGWTNRAQGISEHRSQPMQERMRIGIVEKSGAVQSALRLGHTGIPRKSEDYIPLYVLNMLLGGYFNSRINLNLREKHGFTYGARSYFDTRVEAGPFVVSTEVSTQVTVRAIEETLSELRRIVLDPVTEEELTMVKNYVIGSFPLQIETPQQVASRIAMIILYDLEKDYFDTYRARVAALTEIELLQAAKKYLQPEKLTIVVGGDATALRSALGEFGTVELYSAEGKLVEEIPSMNAR